MINELEYIDSEGNLLRLKHGNSKPIFVGEAYGFFSCSASKRQIAQEIPGIRDMIQTPNGIDLYLAERIRKIIGGGVSGSALNGILREANLFGMNYMFQARSAGMKNERVADELAVILNQMYQASQSPLFKPGEYFNGAIFYEKSGQFVFRD